MSRSRKQAVITLLLLSTVTLLLVAARPKPLRPGSESVGESSVPPQETLRGRLATVDSVAWVRVVGEPRVRAVDTTEWLRRKIPGLSRSHRSVFPVTEWTLHVVEAFKPRG